MPYHRAGETLYQIHGVTAAYHRSLTQPAGLSAYVGSSTLSGDVK
jgi:hypothetical protein